MRNNYNIGIWNKKKQQQQTNRKDGSILNINFVDSVPSFRGEILLTGLWDYEYNNVSTT